MADYKDIDPTEKNIMESMGYHWNGHGWQRALQGSGDDMIVEGWSGSPPKSPDNVTRIWDQKIGEMNKPKSPFDEDEDFIVPMSEGMKGIYREESDNKIKYATTLEADLEKKLQQLNHDVATFEKQVNEFSGHVSEFELAKMQLALSKVKYERDNSALLKTEASKRRAREQYLKQNNEQWFLSLENPGRVKQQLKVVRAELSRLFAIDKDMDIKVEQAKKALAAAKEDVQKKQKKVDELKSKDAEQIKDALKVTADFYNQLTGKLGEHSSKVAKELAEASRGKQINGVDDALKSFDKFRNNLNKKYSLKDRQAISHALESINRAEMAKSFGIYSKAFGFVSKSLDRLDVAVELQKALTTDNWRPFFVKMESLAAGRVASAVTAWTFALMVGTPVGILGFAIIMAAMSALVNDSFMEDINKLIGI